MVVRDHIGCAVQLDCGRWEGRVLGARQHVPQWMDGTDDGHGDGSMMGMAMVVVVVVTVLRMVVVMVVKTSLYFLLVVGRAVVQELKT